MTDASAIEHEYVFYVYDDEDPEDPRFSFWMQTEDAGGMSLYERPPEGHGMWLDPEPGSDHDAVNPTDEFQEVVAGLLGDGIDAEKIQSLPSHERYFVSVIHGTAEQHPDSIPNPVWAYLNHCAEVA